MGPSKLARRNARLELYVRRVCDAWDANQQLEDEMLQTMETCAEEDGWQYDCLIYDGALLRKRSDKTITDLNVLMRSTEFAIKEKHGIDISLVQKEL